MTSADAQINSLVPANMSLYENKTFLLTVLKDLEKSPPYFLDVHLFSVQHRNHLGSVILSVVM